MEVFFSGWMVLPLFASLAIAILLAGTKHWHGHFTSDELTGVQKVHHGTTPRVGGLPVLVGMLTALAFMEGEAAVLTEQMLLASVPAFLFGFVEDLTKRVGVRERLLATMSSGIIAWGLTGVSIIRADVWGLDAALSIPIVSVLFTALCVGGVANAVNIIDGLNGLASTTVLSACLGLGLVAHAVGDWPLVMVCMALALSTLGFWLVNWPWAKLFLGDGGAYFLGFCVAWVAVLMLHRHPQASTFAMLLICAHPIFEVMFSIYRRRVTQQHPGMPDRLHFHSLFLRRAIRQIFPDASRLAQNSIAGISVGLMSLPLALLAPLVFQSVWRSLAALLVYVLLYLFLFFRMVGFHWAHPLRFVSAKAMHRSHRYKLAPFHDESYTAMQADAGDIFPPLLAYFGDHYRGYYVQQSLAVEIRIFVNHKRWCLELRDIEGRTCSWPCGFDSPEDAWLDFSKTLETKGVGYVNQLFAV